MTDPRDIIAAWERRYPLAFSHKDRKPLKIGIREDLLAAGHDAVEVAVGIGWYIRSSNYRRRQVAGAARLDLDGKPAGVVTEKEAAHAAAALEAVKKAAQKRSAPPAAAPALLDGFAALRAAARTRRERQHEVTA
ncbi:ProQ/FINO family protein [Mesorhizobium tianshanense]|uniref:ProP effector n=1 Tax=Mesorhizobium tianshanense TaxID=39844 RepID=A0A562NUE1_9HYPH|nr:ProQ/FINO family protein [Mesorhizobium tianshanense]TWI35296.1 ProP effector [Mesorhizobium tianshanense]